VVPKVFILSNPKVIGLVSFKHLSVLVVNYFFVSRFTATLIVLRKALKIASILWMSCFVPGFDIDICFGSSEKGFQRNAKHPVGIFLTISCLNSVSKLTSFTSKVNSYLC
jgi:hypothetical protein